MKIKPVTFYDLQAEQNRSDLFEAIKRVICRHDGNKGLADMAGISEEDGPEWAERIMGEA